jgi:3-methyladenine DNA glycosylase AlkD
MHACTEPNLADCDFFIRKAIGWAQRAYAWTDPDTAEHRQRPTQPGTAVAVERFTNA